MDLHMKALVLQDYYRFEYTDAPTPNFAPDEVLVRVRACGICGSDVHGMDGSTGRRRPPLIMGHEAAGVIAEVGSKVSGWSPGDRVTFDSTLYCGECDFCRAGAVNLCERRRVLGVSCEDYRQPGAFAEFVAVPQRVLYRLPAALPFEHAALLEPFAIALHAVNRAAPKKGATAVVIGAGMIGMGLVQVLTTTGCSQIISVDVAEDRLALGTKLGATATINSAKCNPLERILELTDNKGVDLAFEAVGINATVDLAMRCVCKGGSVTLVGNVSPKVDLPLQVAVTRELSIYGSCASRGEYPACLELMSQSALRPDLLISASAPLSEGAAWFDRLYRREAGLMKVVLIP